MYTIYVEITITGPIYHCNCRIQDGTERWSETSLDAAYESMIKSARVLNGAYIHRGDIEVKSLLRPTRPLTGSDQAIIDAIRSGHSVVVSAKNRAIEYRVTDEEAELIRQIREGEVKVIHPI